MEASRIISPYYEVARIVFAPVLPVYKPIRDCQKSVPARLSILIKTEFSLFLPVLRNLQLNRSEFTTFTS